MRIRFCYWLAFSSWIRSLEAHSMFTNLYVNGESQGQGTCIRLSKEANTGFVTDITSDEVSCGVTGLAGVDRTCPINAGDIVSFKWTGKPGQDKSYVIADSHDGICAVYMKQMSTGVSTQDGSFPGESPAGDGWFKVMYGDKNSNNRWCIDRLRDTKDGVVSVKIPSDIKSGYYLLRPELLSLHRAAKDNPQFYVGCAQVYISGGTGTAKPQTVAIPGYVNMSMPAMTYNIHATNAGPYPEYGPALYKSGIANTRLKQIPSPATTAAPRAEVSTFRRLVQSDTRVEVAKILTIAAEPTSSCSHGRTRRTIDKFGTRYRVRESVADQFNCPTGTIYEVGNLCLPDVPSWTDTDDAMPNCRASSKQCWVTNQKCLDLTSPAVNYHSDHGCYLYQYRCREIDKACTRKVKQGPSNYGKVLTPEKEKLTNYGIMT